MYNRLTGQKIENIHPDDLHKYISAFWLVDPTEQEITLLSDKIEIIEARKKLRMAGQDLDGIPIDPVFTQGLKDTFLKDFDSLINTFYNEILSNEQD